MLVRIKPCEGLQDGRCHLENQGNDSDLRKGEIVLLFDDRVNGRDDRLNHVIKEVGDATQY